MHMKRGVKNGFTLIELLVVIAILSILAVAVVLILNPAELLKQSRDATRISDLAALNASIAHYIADVRTPTWNVVTNCTASTIPPGGSGSCVEVSSTAVDGTGWVPINFSAISSGAPLSRLPIDPVNSGSYYYMYAASTTIGYFELDAKMESTKFSTGGAADVESDSKDGGDNNNVYETGSELDIVH